MLEQETDWPFDASFLPQREYERPAAPRHPSSPPAVQLARAALHASVPPAQPLLASPRAHPQKIQKE